ncbi:MAG: universal stress protein E [Psychromonas sp.]|jgi:universal stress protein E|uniref:universal stress protein n=1 Tax=Psychromonas sp. TaxID=1884585 RepID=UPI0039E2331D
MWTPKNIAFLFNQAVDNQQALRQLLSTVINNQARLTIISVINPPILNYRIANNFETISNLEKNITKTQQKALNDTQLDWEKMNVTFKTLVGEAHIETIREVIRGEYDLLVKAADNKSQLKKIFGRLDMRLLRKCPCPVWLIQPKGLQSVDAHHRNILAAIDASDMYRDEELSVRHELNLKVLKVAYSLAISESTELHVVSVWSAPYESSLRAGFNREPDQKVNKYVDEIENIFQKNFDNLMQESIARVGVEAQQYLAPKTALIKGVPDKMIAKYANDIDANLVVMGTVARTGIAGLMMGNTAESILDQLEQSVVAVKPPGFVSPVQI